MKGTSHMRKECIRFVKLQSYKVATRTCMLYVDIDLHSDDLFLCHW